MVSEDKPIFGRFIAPVTPAEEPRQHREARLRLSASTTIRGDVQGFTRRKNAKVLDPHDPTPWFYEAILKQTTNRPVGALHDLQRAIELNDNRAVYRSSLLLDEDTTFSLSDPSNVK